MIKVYQGNRWLGEATVRVNGKPLALYHGSGPAQLALALCCDALGDNARDIKSEVREIEGDVK